MPPRSTYTRIAAVLLLLGTTLAQDQAPLLRWQVGPGLGEEVALNAALRQIDADETLAGQDAPSRRAKALLVQGAINFFRPFPGGNGRSCATCHDPRDGFTLSPARVEARWQRLQEARRDDPDASDPLFRPLDADDGVDDFTLLRTRALVKVRVPLPSRVRLTDDPGATHVTLSISTWSRPSSRRPRSSRAWPSSSVTSSRRRRCVPCRRPSIGARRFRSSTGR
jgi:hypothetical protein